MAAYGLVVRQGEILLCRVSAQVEKWAGWWTLPGGGVEFGEDPRAAMVREVREEIVPTETTTTHSLRIIFFAEVLGGALMNEIDGSTDLCAWHDLKAVPSIRTVGLVATAMTLL